MKKTHVVSILNQKIVISSDAQDDYVDRIADFVNERVQEVISRTKSASVLTSVLLASLNIADEFHQLKERGGFAKKNAANKVRDLIALIDAHFEEESGSEPDQDEAKVAFMNGVG